MVGEIHHGVFVARSGVIDLQFFSFERVTHDRRQLAGKSLISVRANIGEFHPVRNFLSLPHNFVESFDTAVQSIGGLDLGDLVGLAIQTELTSGNVVAVAANNRTEKWWVWLGAAGVSINRIEAEHHIRRLAVFVRYFQGLNNPAISNDARLNGATFQRVDVNGSSIRHLSK